MNKRDALLILLAFTAGALVGKNWEQIKVFLKPHLKKLGIDSDEAYSIILTFLAKQKEKFSDLIAEMKMANEKKSKKEESGSTQKKKAPKKSTRKKAPIRQSKPVINAVQEPV